MPDFQRSMLISCRDQFDHYAYQHRQKANRYKAAQLGCADEVERNRLERLIKDTTEKAVRNEEMVAQINETLKKPSVNTLADTARFSEIVHEGLQTPKDIQTQLGVHFEEVAEMLEQIHAPGPKGALIDVDIRVAQKCLEKLGTSLKGTEPVIEVKNDIEFLDSICDQLVTATVGAKMMGMNPVLALAEVNRSNMSKLTDGKMAKDPVTNKWIKGPDFTKPNLRRFV